MGSKNNSHNPVLSQSLFTTVRLPERSWRSYLTSGVIHGLLILALLFITVPVIQQQTRPKENVTLLAPAIPQYRPKPLPPPIHASLAKAEIPRPRPKPIPAAPTPPKPVPPPEKLMAAVPHIEPPVPTPKPLPDLKPAPAPAPPKPEVRTGMFQSARAAVGPQKPKELQLGGFGDPNGAPPSNQSRPTMLIAKVGSFDHPQGSGNAGGGGHNVSGGVRQTAFGDGGADANSSRRGPVGQVHQAGFGDEDAAGSGSRHIGGSVKTGAFGESPVNGRQVASAPRAKPVQPALTPVEILSKPRPLYTQEARNLKLEGQVSLDVVFQSNGSVRILRVVKGLGHGLDEAAEQAALRVRFRPATRDGVPVDSSAVIHITFELS